MVGSAELVGLAYVGASRKPTKAMEFSPWSFYGIFRGETGDFQIILEKFRKNF